MFKNKIPISRRYYENEAHNYDKKRNYKNSTKTDFDIVKKILARLEKNIKIADIPSGTGRFIELILSYKMKYLGVDISNHMLAIAKKKFQSLQIDGKESFDLVRQDVFKLDLGNHSIDWILSVKFFKHIPNEKLARLVLKKFFDICKCGLIVQIKISQKKERSFLNNLLTLFKKFTNSKKIKTYNKIIIEKIFDDVGFKIDFLIENKKNNTVFYVLRKKINIF